MPDPFEDHSSGRSTPAPSLHGEREQGQEEAAPRPMTYYDAQASYQGTHAAQQRYDELDHREHMARAYATLKARGEFDPAKHGPGNTEPLTVGEHLELIATGEVLAWFYRHPATIDRAVRAGATWEQIAEATGSPTAQVRQNYREWAAGQHHLWAAYEGKFGLDDTGYAAALAWAAEPEPEAGQ